MDKQFYKVPEVCAILSQSRNSVYRLIAAGELPAVKFGRSTRIAASALGEFVARRTQEAHERHDRNPRRG